MKENPYDTPEAEKARERFIAMYECARGYQRERAPTQAALQSESYEDMSEAVQRRSVSEVLSALLSIQGSPTLAKIGVVLGVSGERARQLLVEMGLTEIRASLKQLSRPTPQAVRRRDNASSYRSTKKSREQWRREGKCIVAGCERDDEHLRCSKCRVKLNGYCKTLRDRRIAKGLCPRCGGLPNAPHTYCQTCRSYMNGTPRACRTSTGDHPSA